MSYGGQYDGSRARGGRQQPRGPRQHQQAQALPVPGRGGGRPPAARPPMTRMAPSGPPGGYPDDFEQEPPGPRPRRKRRFGFGKILLSLVLLFVLFLAGVWIYLDTSINRTDAFANLTNRPAVASGTNWLIVGSDSRAGLTPQEEQQLSTGDVAAAGGGQRTDTIMIAHLPDNSTKPTLV
ncbi:MAG TPA: LytR family transcriptional regulator, partial [Amycolatopsis sp.]|nr:LytR family transcriptional regulator [Amycolatopsis sp.]